MKTNLEKRKKIIKNLCEQYRIDTFDLLTLIESAENLKKDDVIDIVAKLFFSDNDNEKIINEAIVDFLL